MKRAVQTARNIRIPYIRQSFAITAPLASCFQQVSSFPGLRPTRAHYTAMSSSQWTSTPRNFSKAGTDLIDQLLEFEEETLPTYRPEKYYPVHQGEVLHNRYQMLAKLGYGVTSTVWFGKDLLDSKYVVLKVYVTGQETNHELQVYERMNSVPTGHPGKRFIRKLLNHFSIEGPHGWHVCLVHEPLGISASELMQWIPGQAMTLEDLKPCIRQLLVILDYLHSVPNVIHTDLQLKNLLLPAPDDKTLSSFEEKAVEAPSPRKVLKDQTIYKSSRFPLSNGIPLLSDFGEARFGDKEHVEDIMPKVYRAPEVILKMKWDHKVDIWNVAMVAWDLVCSHTLFDGKNPDGIFDDRVHLAELVAVLGAPPPEFRGKSKLTSVFWDESGNWKELAPIPNITLQTLATEIRGEDKEGFLRWLRAALQWNPKDRPTAIDLLYDEWMMKGLKLRKANGSN
ncbi:CMGC protein kinase [Nannizzia gypsea CBS 118893]|uniref:non-specific serine/threonine protein kinase n=1 Tax=Arthroderma gypseum (strain ATCC MYA-4604 / CBS 118893) TaxID=535722 RepID=E4V4E9_ARTGP|nr:CMGC protein kinase [Nannizzia gypsea CBS 118893]EFR04873.1 CMGC protein kinase [Nannizzia gypsea CBS 118893]